MTKELANEAIGDKKTRFVVDTFGPGKAPKVSDKTSKDPKRKKNKRDKVKKDAAKDAA